MSTPSTSQVAPSASASDHTKPFFPKPSQIAEDGYSRDGEATATCFCGAVQLAFPTEGPGLMNTFVCNCYDCRKVTASMFATNMTIDDKYLKHIRGQDNLSSWGQDKTPLSGKTMTNSFCKTCGTLMYRAGAAFPGTKFLRVGTVDDFSLHETVLAPQVELFVKDRVGWLHGVQKEGVKAFDAGL